MSTKEYYREIFDLHLGVLVRSLGIKIKKRLPASRQRSEKEKALWKRYQDYNLDYRFMG